MVSDSSKFLVSEFNCQAKKIFHVEIEIYKSEYRDKNASGKFYAHIQSYDELGNRGDRWNTEDYDSIEKLKKGIKKEMKEYQIVVTL